MREPSRQETEAVRVQASARKGGLRRRLVWFVALYAGAIAAFTALVYSLRAIVPH